MALDVEGERELALGLELAASGHQGPQRRNHRVEVVICGAIDELQLGCASGCRWGRRHRRSPKRSADNCIEHDPSVPAYLCRSALIFSTIILVVNARDWSSTAE